MGLLLSLEAFFLFVAHFSIQIDCLKILLKTEYRQIDGH